jgi:hypothetical protein
MIFISYQIRLVKRDRGFQFTEGDDKSLLENSSAVADAKEDTSHQTWLCPQKRACSPST